MALHLEVWLHTAPQSSIQAPPQNPVVETMLCYSFIQHMGKLKPKRERTGPRGQD